MSPTPVKTSVGSTGAKPPRTKVTFPQNILLFFSTATQIYKPSSTKVSPTPVKTSVGSTDARPPRTKVTFPQRVFLFWPFFSTATQIYESSSRCLPPLLRPQWPPLVQDLLRQRLISSKYSPKIFGSKYFPLLAIFSTQHKYTSYQLGVSDACEDLSWLNWCKTS